MTKEKLIDKCKQLIDQGKYDKVQSCLVHHPMLLIKHFDELKTTICDYAREVDSRLKVETDKEV